MALFKAGRYELSSGQQSRFKIECDALDVYDMRAIAEQLSKRLAPYGAVVGVPTGGNNLANYMKHYVSADSNTLLIVDDVYTTGASMEDYRRIIGNSEAIGAVIFARNFPPAWITPLFIMHPERDD